jgi:two-component system, NtrC family, sensor kinase
MKHIAGILILLLLPLLSQAQVGSSYQDSLITELNNAPNDTIRMDINRKLGFFYQDSETEKAEVYHMAQLDFAKKLQLKLWEADAYQQIAYCYNIRFNLPLAYENYMKALEIAEDPGAAQNSWGYSNFSYSRSPDEARLSILGMIHFELSGLYNRTRYHDLAYAQLLKGVEIGRRLDNLKILSLTYRDLGTHYLDNNMLDSSFIYYQSALEYYSRSPYQKNIGTVYANIGRYYMKREQFDSTVITFHKGIELSMDPASRGIKSNLMFLLGIAFMRTDQLDSALIYTTKALEMSIALNNPTQKARSFSLLGRIYKLMGEYPLAFDYLEKGKNLEDSLNNNYVDRLMQFVNLDFDQKIRLQELEKEQERLKSRNRMIALLTWLGVFILAALFLYRNNRQKQQTNKVLETTLDHLRATQAQLIQSEKMASLGELTAGIAHEIQNPLNFVNNFSEVSIELIEEVMEEVKAQGLAPQQTITEILSDIQTNLTKINHHGKRADAIVKGMLDHSRTSSGEKTPTDINALADEYLRLSYHGLRAKDKSFNADFNTDFDPDLPHAKVIPQDMGRVLLNLINNAFYAAHDKAKMGTAKTQDLASPPQPDYKPTVTVSTKNLGDQIEIMVKDNGNGIPDAIKDKIFQPFFTTKPTGQGTGLGLSLSYDIVKAHGGVLKVETQENKGSIFTILIPVS